MEAILTSPSNDISVKDLHEDIPEINGLANILQLMPRIVESVSKQSPKHNRPFSIISSEYIAQIPFDSISPETRATYEAIDQLLRAEVNEYDINSLVELILANNEELDGRTIRHNLFIAASSSKSRMPGLVFEKDGFEPGKLSRVRVVPEHETACTELCNTLDKIYAGKDIDTYTELARDLIKDENVRTLLMNKAGAASAKIHYRVRGSNIAQEIQKIFEHRDRRSPLTPQEVHERLKSNDVPASLHTVRIYLSGLAKKGDLGIVKHEIKAGGAKRLAYVPAESE
jgi:hypothetical protein